MTEDRHTTASDVPASFEAAPLAAAVEADDAHAVVDTDAVLEDVSLVVPTNREQNYTTDSTPDSLDVVVRRDDGLNVARNRGVEAAENDWIVLVDDDVTFPTRLTALLVDAMHPHHLVGLEDFWPLRWVIGRYMVFHRDLWTAAGKFDESRPHGGDTDFAIRCEKAGAQVCRLPRHLIPHHDAASDFSTATHTEWLWYLFKRHPATMAPAAVDLALGKVGLRSPPPEYPPDWEGQAFIPPSGSDRQ